MDTPTARKQHLPQQTVPIAVLGKQKAYVCSVSRKWFVRAAESFRALFTSKLVEAGYRQLGLLVY